MKITTNSTYGVLLIILAGMSILSTTKFVGPVIGDLLLVTLSLVAFFAIFIYTLKKQSIPKFILPSLIFFAVFLVITFLGIHKVNMRFFINVYQFITVFSLFLVFVMMKWHKVRINLISRIAAMYILINFIIFLNQGFPSNFAGIFLNPNGLSALLFFLTFFVTLKVLNESRVLWVILLLITLVLIYFSGARSVLVSLFFTGFTYFFWGIITKRKKVFTFYLLLILGSIITFTFIFPQAIHWNNFQELNKLAVLYTGQHLFSGREIIWGQLIAVIKQHILIGHGAGTVASDVLNTDLSAHNLYLQVSLQTGMIGLGVFFLLLASIWRIYWSGRQNKTTRLSAAFFIGMLMHQTFEVMFIQNNLALSVLMWLIIAIGISESREYKIN